MTWFEGYRGLAANFQCQVVTRIQAENVMSETVDFSGENGKHKKVQYLFAMGCHNEERTCTRSSERNADTSILLTVCVQRQAGQGEGALTCLEEAVFAHITEWCRRRVTKT